MTWKECGRNKGYLFLAFFLKFTWEVKQLEGTIMTIPGPRFEHWRFQVRSLIANVPTNNPLKKQDITDCGGNVCINYARMIDV
jgi:hypothetical protein